MASMTTNPENADDLETNAIVTMDGFSAASLTAACKHMSHRAVSTTMELAELAQRLERDDPILQVIQHFSAKLQQFRRDADQLHRSLGESTVMSPKLQTLLTRYLKEFEEATAAMDKQVKRLGPETMRFLNAEAVSAYQDLHVAISRAFSFFIQVLSLSVASDHASYADVPADD
jgi:glutamate/tyrosine decarboxylase-like PLP-dependent enzyme